MFWQLYIDKKNIDNLERLTTILQDLLVSPISVVFPVHPCTRNNLVNFQLHLNFHFTQLIP